MSQKAFPDVSFEHWLKCKLEKLEEELVQAHLQALKSADTAALNWPVPGERQDVAALDRSAEKRTGDLHQWLADMQVKLPNSDTKEIASVVEESQFLEPLTAQNKLLHQGPKLVNACSRQESFEDAEVSKNAGVLTKGISAPSFHLSPSAGGTKPAPPTTTEISMRLIWQHSQISVSRRRIKRRTRFMNQLKSTLQEINAHSKQNKEHGHMEQNKKRHKLMNFYKSFKCVIHPFSKSWMAWELLGLQLLIHDIVLVPMQVFDMPRTTTLTILQWVTIIYWTTTFLLTFLVSYQTASQATLITSRSKIAMHYLKGWFALDIFLVGSDWMGVGMEIMFDHSDSGLRTARMARMARMGRLLRTLRLLRMMRLGELMQRLQHFIDSEYLSIILLIAGNLVAILCLAHVAACIWFGIASEESTSWLQPLHLTTAGLFDQYILSLGWALSTLLGNSVTQAYPQTKVEYSVALVILLTGTIAVSLVFSSTTAAMTRLQQMQSAEREATFKLKSYLRQHHISGSLEARVLRYVDIARSVHSRNIASSDVRLLSLLSGPLRLELQLELHAPHMMLHTFFKMYYLTSAGAMSEICLKAVGWIFLSRYDALFQALSQAPHMYFLEGGVMVYRRAKGARKARSTVNVDKNTSFCESALWTYWIHRGRMVALIESQILALDVASFCDITESHHDVFLKACEYAADYVRQLSEFMEEDGFVWDVPSELMYPDKYDDAQESSVAESDPGYIKLLRNAEEVSSALMDHQSDSDSEDERILQSALACSPSSSSKIRLPTSAHLQVSKFDA